MAQLYLAYLGGQMGEGRIGEDHEAVIVAAEDEPNAKRMAKEKWKGKGAAHVDMLIRLEQVDGYEISLIKNGKQDQIQINDNWKNLNSP